MTLPSRHRIRNSSPGSLRPSTLPLGHGGSPQYWLSHVDGEETFLVSFKPPSPGAEPRTLAWKAAVLTTTLGPPPGRIRSFLKKEKLFNKWHNGFRKKRIAMEHVLRLVEETQLRFTEMERWSNLYWCWESIWLGVAWRAKIQADERQLT